MDAIIVGYTIRYKCPHCLREWGRKFNDPEAVYNPLPDWAVCRDCAGKEKWEQGNGHKAIERQS